MPSRRADRKKARNENTSAESETKRSKLREYFESLIVAIILAMMVKTFSVQTFQIPTGSMEDNLLIGDHIIVNKLIYGPEVPWLKAIMPMRDVRRGDIVIFKFPGNPAVYGKDARTDYIKRVIGLPGETVRVHRHQIYIDGAPIEELGLDEDRYTLHWRAPNRERAERIDARCLAYDPAGDPAAKVDAVYKVPEGHYMVMGDHRDISLDGRGILDELSGRYEHSWTVPRENIIGRAILIYWSYEATREEFQVTDPAQQVSNIIKTLLNFPFKTRWLRMFNIVR